MNKRIPLVLIVTFQFLLLTFSHAENDLEKVVLQGWKLTEKDFFKLEKFIEENPDDISARAKLLGYIENNVYGNPSLQKIKPKHVLWFIENHPKSSILSMHEGKLDINIDGLEYQKGHELWIKHIQKEPDDLSIIKNSAFFFMFNNRALAFELSRLAMTLDPDNYIWYVNVAHYHKESIYEAAPRLKKRFALKSLENYKLAYEKTDDLGQSYLLKELAESSFLSEMYDECKKYSMMMLSRKVDENDWNGGNNMFYGNFYLGKLALLSHDLEEAKKRLILSGKTHGSPQLDSFGPSMELAKEILRKGEQETVLEYLELCSKFWDMGLEDLKRWQKEIRKNGSTDFERKN